ncbi:EEF1A lysine methyltransferase 2 [Galendromus occidentalis]|uniref:Protein-lysine N-methyltransferase LOC100899504 n=1 Tax=Galendromus occidentalis TaxID=34638 RepID=A0AAJ6QSU2_9ACAR|nr:EEF1A lysine methyltransferase 2 [Galendromus occidentalis]
MADPIEELTSSELGTAEYWKSAYQKELRNFEDHGDAGEVWFGEQIERRIVKYLARHCDKKAAVVDIGCGNGHLLVTLADDEGFENLTGIDYVEEALSLARRIAADSGVAPMITFMQGDLLSTECSGAFDVIVDKGTYDAICLMPGMCDGVRRKYIESIKRLMNKQNSDSVLFLITSCNWTKDELLVHFRGDFELISELPAPTFSFGGSTGRTVTSLVFRIK